MVEEIKTRRRSIEEGKAGLEYFAKGRPELVMLIIGLAIMVAVIEPKFRAIMYLVVFIGLVLFGYKFYSEMTQPVEEDEEKEEKEPFISTAGKG